LSQGGSTYGATLAAPRPATCRTTLPPSISPSRDYPRALSLTEQRSPQRRAQRFVTVRLDVGNNSSSDYLRSYSLNEELSQQSFYQRLAQTFFTCRANLPAVTLSATRPDLSLRGSKLRAILPACHTSSNLIGGYLSHRPAASVTPRPMFNVSS
jgi:hypothetical protein